MTFRAVVNAKEELHIFLRLLKCNGRHQNKKA